MASYPSLLTIKHIIATLMASNACASFIKKCFISVCWHVFCILNITMHACMATRENMLKDRENESILSLLSRLLDHTEFENWIKFMFYFSFLMKTNYKPKRVIIVEKRNFLRCNTIFHVGPCVHDRKYHCLVTSHLLFSYFRCHMFRLSQHHHLFQCRLHVHSLILLFC